MARQHRAQDAATNMKITAQDLQNFKVIDEIIPEPVGGAHRAKEIVIDRAGSTIETALQSLSAISGDELKQQRREKFLRIGRELG